MTGELGHEVSLSEITGHFSRVTTKRADLRFLWSLWTCTENSKACRCIFHLFSYNMCSVTGWWRYIKLYYCMSNLHPKSGSNQLILFSHQQKAVRCYRNLIFQGYCVRQECLFWGAWKVIEKGIFRIKSYIEFILNSVLCPECLIGRMNHFIVVDSFHVGEKRIIAIPILGAFFFIEFILCILTS